MSNAQARKEHPPLLAIEFVPSLPGGRAAIAIEQPEALTWLIAEGHMTEQCRSDISICFTALTSRGQRSGNPNDKSFHHISAATIQPVRRTSEVSTADSAATPPEATLP